MVLAVGHGTELSTYITFIAEGGVFPADGAQHPVSISRDRVANAGAGRWARGRTYG
jgi:hypothetical protein